MSSSTEGVAVNMDQYQRFIHMSRYARWREDLKRRETWEETVQRYITFFAGKCPEIPEATISELHAAILKQDIMPSMRALFTAGKALERDNAAGYNCTYVAIDHPKAFDEILYLLCSGCGTGFSVERQFIAQLPVVAEEFFTTDTVIHVKDSKIGWASGLRELISLLYTGLVPKWDMSAVREAGAPLKTFGGRASGPEPLERLFKFTVNLFKNASGRKLTSLEAHDLVCMIGNIVVVGGVRRSATISLSNLSDDRMRGAKSGQWWVEYGHRALANNSVAYSEKPDMGVYMQEWSALYESKSGERGVFNRVAATKQAQRTGRRNYKDFSFGTNPCVTGDTWVLTSSGPRQVTDLLDSAYTAVVNGKEFPATAFWKTGEKPVFRVATSRGFSVDATEDHKILVQRERTRTGFRPATYSDVSEWVAVRDLKVGDKLVLGNNEGISWAGEGSFNEGWLVGEVIGDGCYNPASYPTQTKFWGSDSVFMANTARQCISALKTSVTSPKKFASQVADPSVSIQAVSTRILDELCAGLIEPQTKLPTLKLEKMSSEFVRGLVRGLFDADGTVLVDKEKGVSVRFAQSNLEVIAFVQRSLARLGIISTLYSNRRPSGKRLMPDGKGGSAAYACQANHELSVSRNNIERFNELVGFYEPCKAARLTGIVSERVRTPYQETFTTEVTSITEIGTKDVYDCTVDVVHAFDANGIIVHNCGEIILRSKGFCNLTEVIIRENDTPASLERKVELATILGTMQSTLTNFRYLRKEWQKNAEEERLLGVSLTGIMDNALMSGKEGAEALTKTLEALKAHAIKVNTAYAGLLGINASVALSAVKPSGTVSQLVNSASGIHPRFAPYYIRTVRSDRKDPLGMMLMAQGVPCAPDVTKPSDVLVFSFPVKAPSHSVLVDDITALDQLRLYMIYKNAWTEHNVSITVYVRESEWMAVGAWVYEHFDEVGGISFLPKTDHVYEQAPYQAITKEQYEGALALMPTIDWTQLSKYETVDNTTGAQERACMGGACEVL